VKKLTLLLSIFFIPSLFADCKVGEEVIKDGVAVSLFDEGNSLSKVPQDDQDGMATCYANSLAMTLSSVIPSHPKLSYLDIAFQYGDQVNSKETKSTDSNSSGFFNADKGSFFEYGFTCKALYTIQNNGGVCSQNLMNIELQTYLGNSSAQGNVLNALSQYFDEAFKLNGAKSSDGATQAAEVKEFIKKFPEMRREYCQTLAKNETLQDDQVEPIFSDFLWSFRDDLKDDWFKKKSPNCHAWLSKTVFKMDPSFNSQDDNYTPAIQPELIDGFKKNVPKDIDVMNLFGDKTYYEWTKDTDWSSPEFKEKNFKLTSTAKGEIVKLAGAPIPDDCGPDFVLNSQTSLEAYASRMMDKIAYSRHNTKSCEAYIKDDLRQILYAGNVENGCSHEFATGLTSRAFVSLMDLNFDVDQITNALMGLNRYAKPSDPFYELLGPECAKNRIPVNNFKCEQSWAKDYTSKNNGAQKWGELISKDLHSSIREGRALILSTCSEALEVQTDTNYCRGEKARHHSVTLTGYRCEGVKIQYELTNSWGKSCSLKGGSNKNDVIECQKSGDDYNGRIWVEADYMAKNTQDYSAIKPY
jgi:hypothetical protein